MTPEEFRTQEREYLINLMKKLMQEAYENGQKQKLTFLEEVDKSSTNEQKEEVARWMDTGHWRYVEWRKIHNSFAVCLHNNAQGGVYMIVYADGEAEFSAPGERTIKYNSEKMKQLSF